MKKKKIETSKTQAKQQGKMINFVVNRVKADMYDVNSLMSQVHTQIVDEVENGVLLANNPIKPAQIGALTEAVLAMKAIEYHKERKLELNLEPAYVKQVNFNRSQDK